MQRRSKSRQGLESAVGAGLVLCSLAAVGCGHHGDSTGGKRAGGTGGGPVAGTTGGQSSSADSTTGGASGGAGGMSAGGGTGGRAVTGGSAAGGLAPGTGGGGGASPDGGRDASACPAGATQEDCELCQGGMPPSCERACPKVDCTAYPTPAECEAVCAGATCCQCTLSSGNEHRWLESSEPIPCGLTCTEIAARWAAAVATSEMTVCEEDADCIAVGGSNSCGCASALAFCGKAVNRAAYAASAGPALEVPFARDCRNTSLACDCGIIQVGCRSGECVVNRYGCCFPQTCGDAGVSGG